MTVPLITILFAGFGGLFLLLLFLGFGVMWLVGRRRHSGGGNPAEEARVIQQVYRQLGDMEKRVESLETILLANSRLGSRKEDQR